MAKFRIAEAGLATLREIESEWSFVDFWDAIEYLDLQNEAEAWFLKRAQQKKG